MTALTSLGRVLGPRIALTSALLASACQHDSGASFDDTALTPPDTGGSSNAGASNTDAGKTSQGASSAGGTTANAGGDSGGKASAGAAGSATAGAGGKPTSNGGKAGMDAGGAAGQAGKGGQGGSAGVGGTAGTAGAKNDPVTIDITDIADTDVESCMQQLNHGEAKSINVDGDNNCVVQSLLNAPLQDIPDGAVVNDATLTLNCINVGDPVTVYYVNESWVEDSVRWYNKPAVGQVLGTVMCTVLGAVTIDLKAAVTAWLAGDHGPYGIYLRTEATDGMDFSSSEADDVADRPKLTVTYTLPVK